MSSATKFVPVSIKPAKLTLVQKKTQLPRILLNRTSRKGPVFAQGRLRNQNSKAAKRARSITEARIEKYTDHPSLGENIFAWNHIKTNQVVYSLHRTLTGHDALPQLTFVGKKSLPPTLRKDHWIPFLHIRFPSPTEGLNAFRMLREFRKRHEFDYPLDRITVSKKNPFFVVNKPYSHEDREHWEQTMKSQQGQLASKKARKRILADQKANAVADIAKVLELQTEELSSKEMEELERKKTEKEAVLTDSKMRKSRFIFVKWAEGEKARIDLLKAALTPMRQKWLGYKNQQKLLVKRLENLAREEDTQKALQKEQIKAKTEAEAMVISLEKKEENARNEVLELDKIYNIISEQRGKCASSEEANKNLLDASTAAKAVATERLELLDKLKRVDAELQKTDATIASFQRARPNLDGMAHGPRKNEREWRMKVLQTQTAIAAKEKAVELERAKIERLAAANLVRRAEKRAESRMKSQGETSTDLNAESMAAASRESHLKALKEKEEKEVELLDEYRASEQNSKITLLWAALPDSSFAPSWPKATIHGYLPPLRHNFEDNRFDEKLAEEGFAVGEGLMEVQEKVLRRQGYAVGVDSKALDLEEVSDIEGDGPEDRGRFAWLKRMIPFGGRK